VNCPMAEASTTSWATLASLSALTHPMMGVYSALLWAMISRSPTFQFALVGGQWLQPSFMSSRTLTGRPATLTRRKVLCYVAVFRVCTTRISLGRLKDRQTLVLLNRQ